MPKKTNSNEYIVYRYWSPNGKSYIGQTCQKLDERSGKQGQLYWASTHFFNAINKYGWDWFKNHREILKKHLTMEEADYWESYYIDKYDSRKNGYNIQSGGSFNPAEICSKPIWSIDCVTHEMKWYPSAAEAARQTNVGRRQLCRVAAHEERRFTAGGYVWIYAKEWDSLTDQEKNKYFSIQPIVKNKQKKVILINTGQIFDSIKEAHEATGINNISKCCRGQAKSAGKINGEKAVWQFYDEFCSEQEVA